MSLNNIFSEAIEAGAVEGDILRAEDLKIKIMPMGALELTEFIPEYINIIKNSDRPMNEKFIHNLMAEIVEKEISLGICEKINKKSRVEELKNNIPKPNYSKSPNGIIEKDGCYRLLKISGDDVTV